MSNTDVLTLDTFDMAIAKRGQEITEEVYNNFLNCMPPIGLKGGQGCVAGFQLGEPYCHRTDTRTGQWRGMYATFTAGNNRYHFQGINFAGEVDSRSFTDPKENIFC